jgi:hypothetical protein
LLIVFFIQQGIITLLLKSRVSPIVKACDCIIEEIRDSIRRLFFSEVFGLDLSRFAPTVSFGKTPKLERLEEVKVVTRLP